jgi:anti-sigma B factor antagonist
MLFSRAELRQLPEDHWLIVLHGEHDLSTSPCLGEVLAAIPRPHDAAVIVDLGSAEFIDSTVLNAIVRYHAGGAPIALRAQQGSFARQVLDQCRLGERIAIYESVEDALVGLHGPELAPA